MNAPGVKGKLTRKMWVQGCFITQQKGKAVDEQHGKRKGVKRDAEMGPRDVSILHPVAKRK